MDEVTSVKLSPFARGSVRLAGTTERSKRSNERSKIDPVRAGAAESFREHQRRGRDSKALALPRAVPHLRGIAGEWRPGAEQGADTPPIESKLDRSLDQPDAVDATLAKALGEAATAGRFDVVAQLARELEARRLARAGNVTSFDAARRARRKPGE
jgi:hypothetical protein